MLRDFVLVAGSALLVAASASATDTDARRGELIQSFASLQSRDQHLLDVGWKLAAANAAYCSEALPSIGLLLTDMAAYGEQRKALRDALQLPGDIAVLAVARGSPAQAAGLWPNAPILGLDGEAMPVSLAEGTPAWRRVQDLHDRIDLALREAGSVEIAWRDRDNSIVRTRIGGASACASRFEVLDDGSKAMAEGARVIFGRDFPGFGYPEPEFAAAVAHELAHNLLGHRAWLAEHGRKRKHVRLTEREADRLMPWLLANAGYDPAAARSFMERWGPRHGGGLLRKRTHDGWDERVEFIAAELTEIAELRAAGQPADWASHFRRDVQP